MADILINLYPWVKSLHVISVISWMAGLLYLPRLYVHHVESVDGSGAAHSLFQTMEDKLLRVIMNPAMIATWLFGGLMVFTPGIIDWSFVWPWVKAVAVLVMSWFHMWLSKKRREIAAGTCQTTGKQFRLMNEVPTVAMIVIVIMVIARPF